MRARGHPSLSTSGASQGRPPAEPSPSPDVVGYLLDEARAVLADAGWTDVDTVETRPPRRGLTGPLRVLRQRITAPGRIALVVSGERPVASEQEPGAPRPVPRGSEAAPPAGESPRGAADDEAPA